MSDELIRTTNRDIEIAELGRKDGLVTHTTEHARALVSAIESLTAERDRLAAELAGLRAQVPVARLLRYKGNDYYQRRLAESGHLVVARSYLELVDGMYEDTWEKVGELYAAPVPAQVPDDTARIERLRGDVHTALSTERECRDRLVAIEAVCRRLVARRNSDDGYTVLTVDLEVLEGLLTTPTDAPVPAQVPSTAEETLRAATQYAHDLAVSLHRDHYADNTTFEPFDDILGLISQIDNMVCGWKEPAHVTGGIVDTLRKFNAWRQGDDTVAAPDPQEITRAIDDACAMLAAAQKGETK